MPLSHQHSSPATHPGAPRLPLASLVTQCAGITPHAFARWHPTFPPPLWRCRQLDALSLGAALLVTGHRQDRVERGPRKAAQPPRDAAGKPGDIRMLQQRPPRSQVLCCGHTHAVYRSVTVQGLAHASGPPAVWQLPFSQSPPLQGKAFLPPVPGCHGDGYDAGRSSGAGGDGHYGWPHSMQRVATGVPPGQSWCRSREPPHPGCPALPLQGVVGALPGQWQGEVVAAVGSQGTPRAVP